MPSLQFYLLRAVMPVMKRTQENFPVHDIDTLARFRRRANRIANLVFHLPRRIALRPDTIGGVPGDWLVPPNAPQDLVMVFLHGGGIIYGWENPNRYFLAYLALYTGLRAFGVDYRTMPGSPYPAAHEDCFNVYRSLVEQGKTVILVGESSGGALALATLLRIKAAGLPQPPLCALLSPAVDMQFSHPDIPDDDAFASLKYSRGLHQHYTAGVDPNLPDLNPIAADLSGIAALLILAGGREMLRTEAQRLVETAKQHQIEAELILWPYVWHAWHQFVPYLPEAKQAVKAFAKAILESTASQV